MSSYASLEEETLHAENVALRRRVAELEARLHIFERVLEHAPDVIAQFDREFRHIYVSPAVARVTGLPVSDFIGKTNRDLGMPADLALRWEQALEQVFTTGQPTQITFSFPAPDGVRHYESRLAPVSGPDGGVATVLSDARDITNYVCAAEQLRAREYFIERIIATSPDIIYVYDLEERHNAYINREITTVLGYTPAQIAALGASVFATLIHPDDLTQLPAHLARAAAAADGEVVAFEYRMRHVDGSYRWLLSRETVFARHADGRARQLLGIAQDVTNRRQAEQDLREMRARLAYLLQESPAVIFSARGSGDYGATFVSPNVTALTGYQPEDFTSDPNFWATHLHPDDAPDVFARISRLPIDGRSQQEYRFLNSDGTYRWMQAEVRLVCNAAGEPQELIGYWIDIAERKRVEEERRQIERKLQEAQRLESLGVLAGGVAHDFNNLLTVILGYAEMALNDLTAVAAQASIKQIVDSAQQAARLTSQMLAYAGRGRFVLQPLQLNAIVHEICDLLRASITPHCVVHYELADNLPLIKADGAQIRQVVMNLIINAAEAMGDSGGTITLVTHTGLLTPADLKPLLLGADLPPGRYVCLTVSDTGGGMNAATMERIFDPFFTTKFTGRGLGLAAVQGIVRSHGGALHVASAPAQGAAFRIWFPAVAQEALPVESDARFNFALASQGTILLIDDEEPVRTIIGRMLNRLGYTVLTAENGEAGLELLRTGIPDLIGVLVDLTMPQLRGDMVTRAVHELRPGTPVVLMSGYNAETIALEYADLGLAGLLQKPTTINTLREVMGLALRRPGAGLPEATPRAI